MLSWHDRPRPLAFRQVMEGRPVAAQGSRLFLMPAEIHDDIFGYLDDDRDDLAALALVNSDCRQIARSYQFRAVTFNGSLQCDKGILALLRREAIERRQDRGDYGRTRQPSLGVCVRRVTAAEGGLNKWMNANRPGRQATPAEHRRWWSRLPLVIGYLNRVYRPAVLSVVASLPHLDAARTLRSSRAGGLVLDEHLLNSLAGSTLRTLELRVTMAPRCPQVVDGVSWPLEALDLRLEWDHHEHHTPGPGRKGLDASAYCDSILRLCCAALERLRICLPPPPTSPGAPPDRPAFFFLQFPRLRRLDVLDAGNLHPLALRSLLTTSRRLEALSIDCTLWHVQRFLGANVGPDTMPALEVLITRYQAGGQRQPSVPVPPHHGRRKVTRLQGGVLERLVAVASRCPGLRRLSMTFEDAYIPGAQLEALAGLGGQGEGSGGGGLQLLEELHLGAGPEGAPRAPRWLVDHGDVRRALSGAWARGLKKLVLTGDAYKRGGGGGGAPRYCKHDDGGVSAEHRRLMRAEALEYARALPRLELVYIGIMSFMVIRDEGDGGDGEAWVLGEEDDGFDPVEDW